MKLLAPFPYFGGKSSIAHKIWEYLGDVEHYLEPFFGSGAVLLNRPHYNPARHTETVCDKDGYLCNVWRAIKYAPEEVAKYCDNPVNHIDLASRRKYLIERRDLIEKMIEDGEWYDVKLAGYWIWCSSCWIGGGMLRKPTNLGGRPHLGNRGRGVNKGSLANGTHDMALCDAIHTNIVSWLKQLSDRLRLVRVVSGDWSRICGGNWQDKGWDTVGVYFDPPYSSPSRTPNIYHHDDLELSLKVAQWALERGRRDNYRIVISAYDNEDCYKPLLDNGWSIYRWKAHGGYANLWKTNKQNRFREVLYISPHCLHDVTFDGIIGEGET